MEIKKIIIHTGNWGCGAFGGNVELHTMLQIIAAVSAGVDEMIYHAVDEKNLSNAFEKVIVCVCSGLRSCRNLG